MQSFSTFVLPYTPTMSMSAWHRSLADQLPTYDTIDLTNARHAAKIVLGTQESYEYGANQSAHYRRGMDASSEDQEGITKAVSLRCQEKQDRFKRYGVALSGNTSGGGIHDPRRDTSKIEKSRKQIGVIPQKHTDPLYLWRVTSGP